MTVGVIQKLRDGLAWGQEAQRIINYGLALIRDASATVQGLVRLATNAETTTGTATDIATTPAGVKAVIDALKAAANTWTAAQAIDLPTAGSALTVTSTEAGAGEGPGLVLYRNSASPAANDVIGSIRFFGEDDAGNAETFFAIFGQILDPASGSEDGRMIVRALGAGANRDWYFESGSLRYSTQTQPSNPGEIAAVAYKVGANQVVGARQTGWATATGTATRTTFDTATVTTAQLAERVKALLDDLHSTAGHGLIGT
jgi:hypothetical protein